MSREQELRRQGWEKRTTYDEPRLSELVEMYEEMGFEVRLEPVHPEDEPGCTECMKMDIDRYKTIYVRKKAINKDQRDDRRQDRLEQEDN